MTQLAGERSRKVFFILCLIVYLLLLVKLIIFKYPDDMMQQILAGWSLEGWIQHLSRANLIPFKTIADALFNQDLPTDFPTLRNNIVAFLPLGFLLPLIAARFRTLLPTLAAGLLVSLAFELIQLFTMLGEADVDDVILNVLGTVVGYSLLVLLSASRRPAPATS